MKFGVFFAAPSNFLLNIISEAPYISLEVNNANSQYLIFVHDFSFKYL